MGNPVVEPAKDHALVEELAGPAAALFNRHLAASKQWYPFEDVPWDNAADFAEEAWNAQQYPLSQGVQSAIIVNVLTEDNLPYYTHTLMSPISADHPLREWSRRWTAEEWRHSAAIRDWILATRAIDPYRLEDDRMVQMSKGQVPQSAERRRDDLLCELPGARHPGGPPQHRHGSGQDQGGARRSCPRSRATRDCTTPSTETSCSPGSRSTLRRWCWRSRASCATSRCRGRASPVSTSTRWPSPWPGYSAPSSSSRPSSSRRSSYWRIFELEGLSPEADRAREKLARTSPASPAWRPPSRRASPLSGLRARRVSPARADSGLRLAQPQ